MKVLMFGWEFPPFNSGGLGTACYGITKALSKKGVSIDFVLPRSIDVNEEFIHVISANLPTIRITAVDSLLTTYMTHRSYWEAFRHLKDNPGYSPDLVGEVLRYAQVAREIAGSSRYDVIHCHDWMTLLAGKEAKKISGKPLVSHIHSTEADRSGGLGNNPEIFRIEKEGIESADRIIAVSNFTKEKIAQSYGVEEEKIDVVYNGVERQAFEEAPQVPNPFNKKIVLFLGRLTLHKGPDYFLRAAKKVLSKRQDVIFVISGSGDMEHKLIEQACRMGIGAHVFFTGFVKDRQLARIYKMANLYVMPSVSEPFGITALEALASGTPVLLSNQSGASEVVHHCLKVDFWDTDEMAGKILSLLENKDLEKCLRHNCAGDVSRLDWETAADRIMGIYENIAPTACGANPY
jgi:glycosyltransferase involved in cell wall biosynthesis